MLTDDRSTGRRLMVAAVLAVTTAASYLAWVAWNSYRNADPRTITEGWFEPWLASVVLYLALGVIAGVAGWRHYGMAAMLIIPATMTVSYSIIAVTNNDDQGRWVIGAILIAIITFFWVSLIALLTEVVSRRKAR